MSEEQRYRDAEPAALEWSDAGDVIIAWEDGSRFVYPLPFLREQCPCAGCKGTHGAVTTLVTRDGRGPAASPQEVLGLGGASRPPVERAFEVKSVTPAGHYAIQFVWGDEHDDGYYTWAYLRHLGDVLAAEQAGAA